MVIADHAPYVSVYECSCGKTGCPFACGVIPQKKEKIWVTLGKPITCTRQSPIQMIKRNNGHPSSPRKHRK